MKTNSISTTFTTNMVEESKDFYVKHFGAKVTFDCGWYVNIALEGKNPANLCFMSPQTEEQKTGCADGLTYNFEVEDVDSEYNRLEQEGLEVIIPLENHPWGDRGFAVLDPNGIALYVYSLSEPSAEYKQYFKN